MDELRVFKSESSMDDLGRKMAKLNPSDGEISCMTINVGAAGKTGKNAAKEKEIRDKEVNKRKQKNIGKRITEADVRREIFITKIKQVDPDIICFQEQIPKDLKEADQVMLKDLPEDIKRKYETYYDRQESTREAAVMVKKEKFQNVGQKEMFTDSDKDLYSQIQGRVVLVRAEIKGSPSKVIHIASCHGPHKKTDKIETAENIMKIVTRKVGRSPFIIGGDFNLSQKDFPDASNYISVAADSYDIDYFVYGGNGCSMRNVKQSTYNDPGVARAFLDHVPTVGKFHY